MIASAGVKPSHTQGQPCYCSSDKATVLESERNDVTPNLPKTGTTKVSRTKVAFLS